MRTIALTAMLGLTLAAQGLPNSQPGTQSQPAQPPYSVQVIVGEKTVPITPCNSRMRQDLVSMGKTVGTAILSLGFYAASPALPHTIPGDAAEVVVPTSIQRISVPGYNPRVHAQDGDLALIRLKVHDGTERLYETESDGRLYKWTWKGLPKPVRDAQGTWGFSIEKPLEPGHYAVLQAGGPLVWDFDVK